MTVFSFDAETDGLYGAVWAIGAAVLDGAGQIAASFSGQLDGSVVTEPWVLDNIVPVVDLPRYTNRPALLDAFWSFWMEHRDGAECVADFGAPVEAGLFRACVEQDSTRMWSGPYPMHELGTALLLAGIDTDTDRREMAARLDLTAHDPLDDAVASGLCWLIARNRIGHLVA